MPETTPAGAMPVEAGATPAQSPSDEPKAPVGRTEAAPATGDELGDGGKRALDDERKARRDAEKRAKAAEDALQQSKDAELSEVERLRKQVADHEKRGAELAALNQAREIRLAAVEAAARLNFRNADLAYRLLDQSEIEYAEDGRPKNVEKLLKSLLEKEPYLAKTAPADFGGGNRGTTPSTSPSMDELIRAAARSG